MQATGTRPGRWPHRMVVIVTAMVAALTVPAASVAAQVPNPPADASMPGAALVGKLLGWLKYGSLAAAIAGLLIGAISVGVGHFGSHGGAAAAGRKWLLGGMGAAVLAGLAWTIATTLYTATG